MGDRALKFDHYHYNSRSEDERSFDSIFVAKLQIYNWSRDSILGEYNIQENWPEFDCNNILFNKPISKYTFSELLRERENGGKERNCVGFVGELRHVDNSWFIIPYCRGYYSSALDEYKVRTYVKILDTSAKVRHQVIFESWMNSGAIDINEEYFVYSYGGHLDENLKLIDSSGFTVFNLKSREVVFEFKSTNKDQRFMAVVVYQYESGKPIYTIFGKERSDDKRYNVVYVIDPTSNEFRKKKFSQNEWESYMNNELSTWYVHSREWDIYRFN